MNSKINLCDYCLRSDMPVCMSNDVGFGDGFGGDNIIKCSNFEGDLPKEEEEE